MLLAGGLRGRSQEQIFLRFQLFHLDFHLYFFRLLGFHLAELVSRLGEVRITLLFLQFLFEVAQLPLKAVVGKYDAAFLSDEV